MNSIIKILAIDDNQDNLTSIKALICDAFPGAGIFTELSGPRGIESASFHNPDVILLDVVMPGMDGFEVCRKLKADKKLADIPVVFLTALKGDKESRIRALECGGEAFLAKPIDEVELTAQIKAMVKIKQANVEKRDEKEKLAALVQERTRQLENELAERKKTEKALLESQLLLKSSMESLKETIVLSIDQQYQYLYFNTFHKGVMLSAYGKEVKLGMNLHDCITIEDDKIKSKINYDRALNGESHTTIEEYGDLERYYYETRYNPIINDKNEVIGATAFSSNITERIKAEKELRESEERFKHIFESSNVGKSMTKPTGEINVNQAFCEMLGYTKEELKNKKWQDITPAEEIENTQDIIDLLLKGKKDSARFNKRYLHKDGTPIWTDVSAVILRDQQGKPMHFITTVIDINAQVKAKNALLESEQITRSLLNGLPESAFLMELEGTVIAANNTVAQRLGLTVDELIGKNIYQAVLPEVAERRRKFANQAIETKKPVQFEDERFGKTIDNRIHPVFDLDGNVNRLAIIGIDITERKKAEEKIRESEMMSRSTFDQSPVGAVIVGLDKRFIKCNAAFCRFLGYTEDELIGKTISEVTYPDDIELGMLDLKLMVEGKKESSTLQKRYLRNDGAIVWGEVSISLVRDADNKLMYFLPVIQDISMRKNAEEAVKKSEAKYRLLADHMTDTVWLMDMNLQTTYISPSVVKLSGFTLDEIQQFPLNKNMSPQSYQLVMATFGEEMDKMREDPSYNIHRTLELEFYRKNGTAYWTDNTFTLIRDENEIPISILGEGRDITERKKAEEALRKSEEKYRTIFENVQDVFYQTDLEGNVLEISPSIKYYTEFNREEIIGSPVTNLYYNPADRELIINELMKNGEIRDFQLKLKTSANQIRFTSINARLVLGTDGQPDHIDGAIRDITERKEAEERIKEQEVQYRNLADSGVALIWTAGTDKLCNYFNGPWLRFTGRTLEQELGNGWAEGVHPEDYDRCVQTYIWAFDRHEPFEMEYRLRHASGEYRWIRDMGTPNYDSRGEFIGYIGHCFDITERKMIETELVFAKEKAEKSEHIFKIKNEELLSRNTFIQTILENLPIGIALNEINSGEATYMNKKFQEIYGWSSDEITSIGSFFEKVYPDEEYRNILLEWIMSDIQSGDPSRMHWENIMATHKDGTKRVINAVNIPLAEQNTMVSSVIDITDLHNIQRDLIAAKEKAEESDRLKTSFLANMSHEIRTPMNSIMGFASLLPDEESRELMIKYANIIVNNSEQLVHIIDDIVLYSRLQTKLLSYLPVEFDANILLADIKQSFNLPEFQKGVELIIETGSKEPLLIKSDYEKVRQVFTNLISNAFKYTNLGTIAIGFEQKKDQILFFVKDTGLGIPPNELEKVFDRFYRGSDVDKGAVGGTGLGLSIVKELIELLGGNIWAESDPDSISGEKGTTFSFTLPKNR
jgi:PAS domain S-box-containing protein